MRLCGVDEAGRGPVIGPMVVAGVAVDDEERLHPLALRDSKALSPRQRVRLAERIVRVADVEVRVLNAWDIDRMRESCTLNEMECEVFAEVISSLRVDRAYVDAVDVDAERFARDILTRLGEGVHIVSEHGADARYPVVSAASIIAKVTRDREVVRVRSEIGCDIGSGYPSDPRTREALAGMISSGRVSRHVRRSWETFRKMRQQMTQREVDGAWAK